MWPFKKKVETKSIQELKQLWMEPTEEFEAVLLPQTEVAEKFEVVELQNLKIEAQSPVNVAQPAAFNPTPSQNLEFAEYRSDAIARCLEQRREDGLAQHPEHDFMKAEALSYAWHLVGAKLWTEENVLNLKNRIDGDSNTHSN